MSLEMKAVVLNKLQQMTGNNDYGKTCYNDIYVKTNGESVRRLKCWNYNRNGQQLINASNFKQFQDEIGALSNDQYWVELDRLKYSNGYDYIVIRIITLVQAPTVEKIPTVKEKPTTLPKNQLINVFAPASMHNIVMEYFGVGFDINILTY